MRELPTGTVTFLFTDIEGSTQLLQHLGEERYAGVLGEHHRIVREAMAAHNGVEVSTEGDAFFVAFPSAAEAVAMALAAQAALGSHAWPEGAAVQVRMGLHTGTGHPDADSYVGLAVHQAARISAAAHGCQVVASVATRESAGALSGGASWRSLGHHRLKDLDVPLELFQLCHQDLIAELPPLRSLETGFHLPVQLSSFLGRSEELAVGAKLLAATRLLTVTGPGGTGKTRLAYQLAAEQLHQFPYGVWAAELASVSEAELVPRELMAAMGLRDERGRTATETTVAYLRDRKALVLLDNCEHLIEATAALTADLLRGCRELRVLATSREPLRVGGESVWALAPLAVPAPDEPLEVLAATDAVALFCERAGEAKLGFALNRDNAVAVTEVCRRLEGIPLAIELAAARVRTLSPAQIVERLSHSLDLLSKGERGAGSRQASLRAAIAWSHDLLSTPEQTLFRRLSRFSGSFTLQGAEGICSGGSLEADEVLDCIDGLVDKSLVTFAEDRAGESRYRLLETIGAYAAEHLYAAGESSLLAQRHAAFYARLAHDCAEEGESASCLDRLEAEHPNLLVALEHLSSGDQPTVHGQLAVDLSVFWDLHGHWRLARRELLRYARRPDGDRALQSRCAHGLGTVAINLGDYAEARAYYEEALGIAREFGDRRLQGDCLRGVARVATRLGEPTAAQARYEEALSIAREVGDRRFEGRCTGDLGIVALNLGDYRSARAFYEEALSIAREVGDRRFEGLWVGDIGDLAGKLRDYGEARDCFEKALSIAREVGDRRGESSSLGGLGDIALLLGDYVEARSFLEEALCTARDVGDRRGESMWIGGLGDLATRLGDYTDARIRYETALGIARELSHRRGEGWWVAGLGDVAVGVGDYPEARTRFEEALRIAREFGESDIPLLEACAGLLGRLDRCEDATRLLAAADGLNAQAPDGRPAWEEARYQATLAICWARLDEETLASASKHGRSLDWTSALDAALECLGGVGQELRSTTANQSLIADEPVD